MTTEIETTTPVEQEAAEQVQSVETTPEATTEQPQETTETQEEKAKREPWFQKRISEVTREKYEAKRAADQAMQEAQQLREQLARIQSGEQYEAPAADVNTLAEQRAQQLLAERSFNEACNKVYEAGKSEFPDFDQAASNLRMVGATREFYELATTSDAGAKLIHHLGSDLDEAARIAALPPVQMARELTKLEYKLNQPPPPKPVSKAPAPITPIGAGGATDSGLRDDLSADEWLKRRNKQLGR